MPLDYQALLLPISDDAPAGGEMSFSPAFDAIKEARRFDDATLDQGAWETSLKEADWPLAARICRELLSTQTKDLRLAAWLTEAQAKTAGFAGLADGFRLLARLVADYWQSVHPQAEDGDQEQRIGNFAWLLGRSAQLLREVPITRAAQGVYSTADHEVARALAAAVERNPADAASLSSGKVTLQQFEQSRRNTPYGFYNTLMAELADCTEALRELEQVLDEKLGSDGPSFSATRNMLETVSNLAARFAKDAGVVDAAPEPAVSAESAATSATPQAAAAMQGPIQSRTQAVQQLRAVADYFRKAEPHSPVAYLAEKAAHWSTMPLHVWLRQVLKEPNALSHIEELLGVPPEGGSE